MSDDQRAKLYDDLHGRQLAAEEAQNRESARRILPILFEHVRPKSALDVGCGLGTWLAVLRELDITDVRGVDGPWLDRSRLTVEPALVETVDLEKGFTLGRKFDLVVCLEVAEHLARANAATFVSSLTAHADLVLFSAAIPFQGGHHHVNEQWPDYWAALFATHGFRPLDFLRPRIWEDREIMWWLRQNLLLFAHDRALAAHASLRREQSIRRPLALVHPDVYAWRVRRMAQMLAQQTAIVKQLGEGGTFVVTKQPDGRLDVRKS